MKTITVKGIFDSMEVDNVVQVSRVPNNADKHLNLLDNCRIQTNYNFIFFRSHGENPTIYKKEWSLELENQLKNLI